MTANLNLLRPRVKQLAEAFVQRCAQMGYPVEITATLRTIAEQDALYAQGRTKSGSIVTNARGGQSMHNYACAFDFVPLDTDGQPNWKGDFKSRGKIGEALGLEWGGHWTSFVDLSHLQFTAGYTLADFQRGHIDDAKFVEEGLPRIPKPAEIPVPATPATEPTIETLQKEVSILEMLINLWTQLKAKLTG